MWDESDKCFVTIEYGFDESTEDSLFKEPGGKRRRGCYKKKEKHPCLIPGCPRPSRCKLLCKMHYQRTIRLQNTVCTVPKCLNKMRQRKMCRKHYEEWKLANDGDKNDESSSITNESFET